MLIIPQSTMENLLLLCSLVIYTSISCYNLPYNYPSCIQYWINFYVAMLKIPGLLRIYPKTLAYPSSYPIKKKTSHIQYIWRTYCSPSIHCSCLFIAIKSRENIIKSTYQRVKFLDFHYLPSNPMGYHDFPS